MNSALDTLVSKARPRSLAEIEALLLEAEQQENVTVGSYQIRIWTADQFDELALRYGGLVTRAVVGQDPQSGEPIFDPKFEGIVLAVMAVPDAISDILRFSLAHPPAQLRNNVRMALVAAALRINLVDNAGIRCFFGDGPSSENSVSPASNSSSPSVSEQGTASE